MDRLSALFRPHSARMALTREASRASHTAGPPPNNDHDFRDRGVRAIPVGVADRVVPQYAAGFLRHFADELSSFVQVEMHDTPDTPDTPGQALFRKRAIRVGQNAMVGALGQGCVFGSTFALMNLLRKLGNPASGVFAGGLALAAGALSSYTDAMARRHTGVSPTAPAQPSVSYNFVASAAFLGVHAAFINAKAIPRFAPNTLSGAAMTFFVSCLATFTAGGASEAAAQHSVHRAKTTRAPIASPARKPSERQVAWGRALSLLPMAVAHQLTVAFATRGAVPPRWLAFAPITCAAFGWGFWRNLMPPDAAASRGADVPSPSKPSTLTRAAPAKPAPLQPIKLSPAPDLALRKHGLL
ncbi:MAG TPA: hypothetical protein VLJ86_00525 [Ramlibacter sp.]|nr:hypothetical protein [Ramlibacter sp.]